MSQGEEQMNRRRLVYLEMGSPLHYQPPAILNDRMSIELTSRTNWA